MCLQCKALSRRRFVSIAASGVAAAGLWTVGSFSPSFAATSMSADQALEKIKAGNKKFLTVPDLCTVKINENRSAIAKTQSPWATILTCADSRVSPELVFGGVGLGEFFVCRNAGNVADTAVMGSIEYSIEHLGTPLVVVMGHSRCGGIQAACDVVEKGTTLPGSIKGMVDAILPAAQAMKGKSGDYVDNVVRENARLNALKIMNESEIVKEQVHGGKVKVVYARYDLDTGKVDFLG